MSLNFNPKSSTSKQLNLGLPQPDFSKEKKERGTRNKVACIFKAIPIQSSSSSSSISLEIDPTSPSRERKTGITALPSTPLGNRVGKKIKVEKEFFPNSQNEKEDAFFNTIISNLDINRAYELNGKTYTLFRQNSSKNCGGSSLLMVFTDLVREDQKIILDKEFVEWVSNGSLSDADSLINKGEEYGVELKKEKLDDKNPLDTIRTRIEHSSHSVIVSITHPEIQGHWVVVDQVDDDVVFLRDPYTGNAFAPDKKTFLLSLQGNIEQCLSIVKISPEEKPNE